MGEALFPALPDGLNGFVERMIVSAFFNAVQLARPFQRLSPQTPYGFTMVECFFKN